MGNRKFTFYNKLFYTYLSRNKFGEVYTGRHSITVNLSLPYPSAIRFNTKILRQDNYPGSGVKLTRRLKQGEVWDTRIFKIFSDLDECMKEEIINIAKFKAMYGKKCLNISDYSLGGGGQRFEVILKNIVTGEIFNVSNVYQFCKDQNITNFRRIFEVVHGYRKSYKNIVLVQVLRGFPQAFHQVCSF